MSISRRSFFSNMILSAPAVFMCRSSLFAHARSHNSTLPPLLTNHNDTGTATLMEGKTLLVSISLPFESKHLEGSFPVQISPSSAEGSYLIEPQPLYFYPEGSGRTSRTILSVPLDAVETQAAGFTISAKRAGSTAADYSFSYKIQRGAYRSSALQLSQSFSAPSPEVAARKRRDFQAMVEIYKLRTARRWHSPFIFPVTSPHRNNFGDRRVVNGTKRYRHAGLDFNAPLGTPVYAMNDGVVALSEEQWTPGETICIDHGGGVFSKYMHLLKRHVQKGDVVRRGDVIALSGNSGGQRPGPHLHLDIVINGTHVHPLDFMRTAAQLIALEAFEGR